MLTQPRSPSPTAVRSTNRLTLRGSILSPWPARPKWTPTTVSFLGCTAYEGKSALNITLNWALPPPRLVFSFLNLSRRLPSSAVVYPPVFFSLNGTLRFHRSLCSGAVPVTLSLLPLLSRSSLSWADGSKTHRRGVQSNCRGEWLGAEALCRGG